MQSEIHAAPADAYQQALVMAQSGQMNEAEIALKTMVETLPSDDIWGERAYAAASLIDMLNHQRGEPGMSDRENSNLSLVNVFLASQPMPDTAAGWPVTLLAMVLPGAGHAWLGRYHDAITAALLVWPMLILTVWAARRQMGPVTLFFAVITLWLWSGTVFSSISLAERGALDAYWLWWQQLWLASGLPGRPW